MPFRCGATGALFLLALPFSTLAQSPTTTTTGDGFLFVPFFNVSSVYDDNLFFREREKESVLYTRFRPGIRVSFRGGRTHWDAVYDLSSDLFPGEYERLTDPFARQDVSTTLAYSFSPRSTITGSARYLRTRDPAELIPDTGIDAGLRPAQSYEAGLSFFRGLTPRSTLEAQYYLAVSRLDAAAVLDSTIDNEAHMLRGAWGFHFSPRSALRLAYTYRRFSGDDFFFAGGDGFSSEWHIASIGLEYQWTPRIRVTFEGGPRLSPESGLLEGGASGEIVSSGSFGPELSASISRTGRFSEYSLKYARSQYRSIGVMGFLNTESVSSGAYHQIRRSIRLDFSGGAYRNSRAGESLLSYRVTGDLAIDLARWLALQCGFSSTVQTSGSLNSLEPALTTGPWVTRNVVTLSLSLHKKP